MKRYFINYQRVEIMLMLFYAINAMVWELIFILDIISIGREISSEETNLLRLIGSFLFVLSVGSGVAMYAIAKELYFPNYKHIHKTDAVISFLYGGITYIALANYQQNFAYSLEKYQQLTFSFPQIEQLYTILGLTVMFLPYFLILYFTIKSKIMLQKGIDNRGKIDPLIIYRLKFLERAMYIYLVGALFSLLSFILPHYFPQYQWNNGMSQILSVPLILALIVILFLSLQTPLWLQQQLPLSTRD